MTLMNEGKKGKRRKRKETENNVRKILKQKLK